MPEIKKEKLMVDARPFNQASELKRYDVYPGPGFYEELGKHIDALPAVPTVDGEYSLKCVVASGVATKSWESLPAAENNTF